jgi:hypothetical protein
METLRGSGKPDHRAVGATCWHAPTRGDKIMARTGTVVPRGLIRRARAMPRASSPRPGPPRTAPDIGPATRRTRTLPRQVWMDSRSAHVPKDTK